MAFFCFSLALPVYAGPVIEGDRAFLHKPTGLSFPSRLGSLTKVRTYLEDDEGTSLSVNYATDEEDPILHVAITVAPFTPVEMDIADPDLVPENWMPVDFRKFVTLELGFVNVVGEIGRRNDSLTIMDETFTTYAHAGKEFKGRQADFMFRWARGNRDLNGTVYVFDYDGWIITYRFTYPLSKVLPYMDEYSSFMAEDIWPASWNDPEKSIYTRGYKVGLHKENLKLKRLSR